MSLLIPLYEKNAVSRLNQPNWGSEMKDSFVQGSVCSKSKGRMTSRE